MDRKQHLLRRLDDIGKSLERTGNALALLGLGSVGAEIDRLDEYSDLDFFVVVKPGYKHAFIHNLDWLSSICPIAYNFQNTPDGHKLLFEDGLFCEMAVFEERELADIPFTEGRIVWKAPGVPDTIQVPSRHLEPHANSTEWRVGEAITCLYVGLCRYQRGEKLSAARFIQGYAVDRVVELSELIETAAPAHKDVFTPERRYEQRFPGLAQALPNFIQGYARSRESARAILEFLDRHFELNAAMKARVLELC